VNILLRARSTPPENQAFLERYFSSLKASVTKARADRKAAREKAKTAGADPGAEEPEAIANLFKRRSGARAR